MKLQKNQSIVLKLKMNFLSLADYWQEHYTPGSVVSICTQLLYKKGNARSSCHNPFPIGTSLVQCKNFVATKQSVPWKIWCQNHKEDFPTSQRERWGLEGETKMKKRAKSWSLWRMKEHACYPSLVRGAYSYLEVISIWKPEANISFGELNLPCATVLKTTIFGACS